MKESQTVNKNDEHEIVVDFDKEYGIQDLITRSDANMFFQDLNNLGMPYSGLFYRNGEPYIESHKDKSFQDGIDWDSLGDEMCRLDENLMAYPVVHHFEVLAYFLVEFPHKSGQVNIPADDLMYFFSNIIDQIVGNRYKFLMTSGLHSQVVRDSFEEIKKKNELLEKSEKKYRLLAQSLEKEVDRIGEEIKEAHTQLMHQEKLASIGQLAAGVAHEINNPMGFITSNLRTLKEYTQDLASAVTIYKKIQDALIESGFLTEQALSHFEGDIQAIENLDMDYLLEDIPQLINESTEGTERINKIVSDLKDFAHPGEETPAFADVIQCIESTMNIVWNELKYKTTVTRSFDPLPQIFCYPRQLNQVIMNLLVNAAHSIDKKGEIEITTHSRDDWVEIQIRDTGHGIPEDVLPKIFDPFFTTKEVGKGTGLGLNLAYNIIQKHQGRIQVKSEVGKGTTFTILLPVHADLGQ